MNRVEPWLGAVTRLRKPLPEMTTEVTARLDRLENVRSIVFDIYGTLVISGSGDVGAADQNDRGDHMEEALAAVGASSPAGKAVSIEQLHEEIRQSNLARQGPTCPKPEVDIFEIWQRALRRAGHPETARDTEKVVRLACEYEARANPTWPMPGAKELLKILGDSQLALGIVSNAQAFTVPLLEDLVEGPLSSSQFDLDLCIFSYRYRQAKPGPRLFDALREGLKRRSILPHETLYVGNDMLNDMWAASQAGIRTAWFAGDARSLRSRPDDPRCQSFSPDLILTSLMQLQGCVDLQ